MKKLILFFLILSGSAPLLFAQNELGSTSTHGIVNIHGNTNTYSSSKLRLIKWSNNNAHIDVMDGKDLMLNYYQGRNVLFGSANASAHSVFRGSGVLGINTLGPTTGYHLDVNGSSLIRYSLQVNGSIRSGGGDMHAKLTSNDLQFNRPNNPAYISNLASNGPLAFTTGGGSANIRMIINGSGNVGIGTTNPGSYKLAVEGKIGAREVNVTTAAWADFVFQEDYVLRPLAEVEQFIKEKGHLPDVPSEVEVLENGIEVGAMNATLLQKIEELTLYVIEQQKQMEHMQKEIYDLKQPNTK